MKQQLMSKQQKKCSKLRIEQLILESEWLKSPPHKAAVLINIMQFWKVPSIAFRYKDNNYRVLLYENGSLNFHELTEDNKILIIPDQGTIRELIDYLLNN